jgi:calcium-binding protein CML
VQPWDIATQEKLMAPIDFPHFLNLMSVHLRPETFDCLLCDILHVLDKESLPLTNAATT